MPDIDIDKLQIEVSASSDAATKNIRKLASSMRSLKKALSDTKAISDVANSLKTLSSAIKDAKATVEMANAIKSIGRQESKIGNVADYLLGISKLDFSNLTSASNVIAELAEIAASVRATKPFSSTQKSDTGILALPPHVGPIDLGMEESSKAAKTLAFSLEWLLTASERAMSGIRSLSGVVGTTFFGALTRATRATARFYTNLITAPFRNVANSIQRTVKSFNNFRSSIGRIALYRAIRTVIAGITKGIREGAENLSAYSRIINTEFHKSLDGIVSDALYVKNSFATVAAPIVNFVKPAFDALADSIANALNMLAEFIARLTGAESYSKAIKFSTEYGDAIKEAGDKAKEAKKNLLGIDELNIFQDKNKSGSGFSADDYKSMFEEVKLDKNDIGVAEQVRKAIEEDDWRGAGESLAEKLNESVANLNAYDLGRTIGEKINNAVESVYGFLNTFNFNRLGGQIAEFINGSLSEIDFDTIGRIFTRGFTSAFDLIIGFITKLDWKLVGKSFGDFLRGAFDEASEWLKSYDWKKLGENLWTSFKLFIQGLDVGTLAKSLFDFIRLSLDALTDLISGIDWSDVATTLWETFETFVKEADVESLSRSFFDFVSTSVKSLGDLINGIDWTDVVDTLITTLSDFIRGADIKNLLSSFAYLITSIVVQFPVILTEAIAGIVDAAATAFEELGLDSIAGFLKGVSESVKDVAERLKTDFVDPVVNFVKSALGIHSPSTVFAEIGEECDEGFLKGLQDSWGSVKSWLSEALSNLKQSASDVFQGIKQAASSAWSNLKSSVTIKTPAYATGGFPEDGLFYANHGELVGQFSNGRTAVANNEQIVDGIENGVRDANQELVSVVSAGFSQIINAIERGGNGGGDLDMFANAFYPVMQGVSARRGLEI